VKPAAALPLTEKPYLTAEETVVYLGLSSLNALHQRMKRGTIPIWCYTHLGRSLRFLRAALDEHLVPADRAAALRLVHDADTARRQKFAPLKKVESR
jgi:hypothetical protein